MRLLRRRRQQRDSCTSHTTGTPYEVSLRCRSAGMCCELELTASSCSHDDCGFSTLRFSSSERPLDFSVTQLEEQTLLFLEGEMRLSGNHQIAVERFSRRVAGRRVQPIVHLEPRPRIRTRLRCDQRHTRRRSPCNHRCTARSSGSRSSPFLESVRQDRSGHLQQVKGHRRQTTAGLDLGPAQNVHQNRRCGLLKSPSNIADTHHSTESLHDLKPQHHRWRQRR